MVRMTGYPAILTSPVPSLSLLVSVSCLYHDKDHNDQH
jgi:hypothetical protein